MAPPSYTFFFFLSYQPSLLFRGTLSSSTSEVVRTKGFLSKPVLCLYLPSHWKLSTALDSPHSCDKLQQGACLPCPNPNPLPWAFIYSAPSFQAPQNCFHLYPGGAKGCTEFSPLSLSPLLSFIMVASHGSCHSPCIQREERETQRPGIHRAEVCTGGLLLASLCSVFAYQYRLPSDLTVATMVATSI